MDPSNLQHANAFGPVDLGDELGFELWHAPMPEIAAFAGLDDPTCAPKAVVGWQAATDYSCFAASDPAFEAQMALRGDKLGGWPARLQGTREEPFPCPACRGDTLLLYQLDSDSHAEQAWGDLGRAWLGAAPRHPTRPTYFWECS